MRFGTLLLGGGYLALLLAAVVLAPLPLTPSARAQSQPILSVAPLAGPIGVGEEAPFLVRVSGVDPAALDLRYVVEGGVLVGLLDPAEVGPSTFEAVAYVRRDTPGLLTLRVSLGDRSASASVEAILAGRIRVSLVVHDVVEGASRTWPFEVIDAAGVVVARVNVAASGGFPGSVDTVLLPYGSYTVRQVLGRDTGLACEDGRFFAVRQPSGGVLTLSVLGPRTEAEFVVDVCPTMAPTPINSPTPTPVEAVAGERTPGSAPTPRPPAAGTGLAPAPTGEGVLWPFAGVVCVLAGSLAVAVCRVRR